MKKTALSYLAIAILLAACGGATGKDDSKKIEAAKSTAISVTIPKLIKDYEENEVSADNTYKGKKIKVSGIVETIAKDIMDDSFVTIGAGGDEFSLTSIQCYFEKEGDLASLKKGDSLTVEGKGDGKVMNIILRECSIIK